MKLISNKEEVRAWFAETIYEDSRLVELVINQNRQEIILINSCSTEASKKYQYRFRKNVFYEVKNLKSGAFLSKQFTYKEQEGLVEYNCGIQPAT